MKLKDTDSYKNGNRIPIYSTHITAEISKLQLGQEISGQFMKGPGKYRGPIKYTNDDLKELMSMFKTDENSNIGFINNGLKHILIDSRFVKNLL